MALKDRLAEARKHLEVIVPLLEKMVASSEKLEASALRTEPNAERALAALNNFASSLGGGSILAAPPRPTGPTTGETQIVRALEQGFAKINQTLITQGGSGEAGSLIFNNGGQI